MKIKLCCKLILNTGSMELREFLEVGSRKIRILARRISNLMRTMPAAVSIKIKRFCQVRESKKEKIQRKLYVKIFKISLIKQLLLLNIQIRVYLANLTCSKIFIVINDDL